MPVKGVHLAAIIVFTGVVAAAQFNGFTPLMRLDLATQDVIARVGKMAPPDGRLVFLARDTASAELETATDLETLLHIDRADPDARRALPLMSHEWPWSREVHALVLERLMAAGARCVIFDFTFPKASSADDGFRRSLDRHRDRVAVAGNIADDKGYSTFCGPSPTLIPETNPHDTRVGFDNFALDIDDVTRRAHYRAAMEYGVWRGAEERSLSARALEKAGLTAFIPSGLSSKRIRFAGPPGTFPARSIFEIFAPAYWEHNFNSGAFFRGKIVIIGAAGNWQHDEHHTPVGLMPGPELHLNAINAALRSAFIQELPAWAEASLVIVASLAAGIVRYLVQRPYVRLLMLLVGAAVWFAFVVGAYDFGNVLLPCLGPLLAFELCGITGLAGDILTERREKTHLRRTLERYVSRNVVEEMLEFPDALGRALGGELRPVTILFSDVRDFTRLTAVIDSRALVAQLNEYLTAMVECVFRFDGTLDKFIGDAVMAVWGNARSHGPAVDARQAVACALAMRAELARLNEGWAAAGKPTLRIGVALNSGEVIAGNIGSPTRMEFTVIGEAVNLAWRLQEHTKGARVDILLGETTIGLLGDEFPVEMLGVYQMNEHVAVRYGQPTGTPVAKLPAADIFGATEAALSARRVSSQARMPLTSFPSTSVNR